MDEDLFVKLLDLRKYLHSQADKLIDVGFDVNSEVVDKFFTASSEIIKHIEKIMGIKPYWQNETTLIIFDASFRKKQPATGVYGMRFGRL